MSTHSSNPHEPFSVVVVGSYVQDHVWLTDRFPETGETRRALGFSTGPGGKGFNQAIACLRQDARVLFIGALGEDALGATARAFADRAGLACRWYACSGEPTAAASIVVDGQGANRILVNLAANESLDGAFLRSQERLFAEARVLLVQLETRLDAVGAALDIGKRFGLLCMLNPAPVHAELDSRLLAQCDLITPNEHEFALLLERITGERIAAAEIATLADARLNELCRSLDVDSIVVTLGAAGCFVSHGARSRHEPGTCYRIAAETVQTIDTVGAGDAFNGALAAMLSQPEPPAFRRAVVHANRVAGMSTERAGAALAMPTRAEVVARFGQA